jgi:hypothetical protein
MLEWMTPQLAREINVEQAQRARAAKRAAAKAAAAKHKKAAVNKATGGSSPKA